MKEKTLQQGRGLLGAAMLFTLIFSGGAFRGLAQEALTYFGLPHMETRNVRMAGETRHVIRVYYPPHVEESSLSDGDLWVVSQNGFSQIATFEGMERFHYEPGDPIVVDDTLDFPAPELFVDLEGVVISPTPPELVVAKYVVHSPSDAGWQKADNGRYAVLLEPRQVATQNGNFLKEQHLGFFHVRIDDEPGLPIETEIEIFQEDSGNWARVTLYFPHPGYEVIDWGGVRREENRFFVNLEIVRPDPNLVYPDVIDMQSHRYELPRLEPGAYGFTVHTGNLVLGSKEFKVEPSGPPVPAEASIRIERLDIPQVNAHVRIHFTNPYFVLLNQGEAVLDGKRFVINARASEVAFIQPPEEPAITEVMYELPIPDPGTYEVYFKINGYLYAKTEFVYPLVNDQRPVIHEFFAEPQVVNIPNAVTFKWQVTGAKSLKIEPIVGAVDGNSITVSANLFLSLFFPGTVEGFDQSVGSSVSPTIGDNTLRVPITLIAANEFGDSRRTIELFVDLGEEHPPIPEEVKIDVRQGDASWFTQVEVVPPQHAFVTHWGELLRDGNTFIADVQLDWFLYQLYPEVPITDYFANAGGQIIIPPPEPNYNTYNLGILEQGVYQFKLTSGGQVIGEKEFAVELGGNGNVFTALRSVNVTEAGGEVHRFSVVYESRVGIDESSLGDDDILVKSFARFIDVLPLPVWEQRRAQLVRYEISADAKRAVVVYEVKAPEGGWMPKHNGEYDVCLLPESVKTLEGNYADDRKIGFFRVFIRPNDTMIHAALESEPISEPGDAPHQFKVIYESNSPFDLETFDDEDIGVTSWVIYADFIGFPPIWAQQNATFVGLEASEDKTRVVVVYEIYPPENGWSHQANGPLQVQLLGGAVTTINGQTNEVQRLGAIPIEIEPNWIPARASISLARADGFVAADVRVLFFNYPLHSIVKWGEPEQIGDTFILNAKAVEVAYLVAPELPIIEEHRYRLIPLPTDALDAPLERRYNVEFRINGLTYAENSFSIPEVPPPDAILPSDVLLTVETDANGTAHVHTELDFSDVGFPVNLQYFEDPFREDQKIKANAVVNRWEDGDVTPSAGAPPVFTNDYYFENLVPGYTYSFVMQVNGYPVGRILFAVEGDRPFEDWLAETLRGSGDALPAGAALTKENDLDGDGASDFSEWAFGSDALNPNERNGVVPMVLTEGGKQHLGISYLRRIGDSGVTYKTLVSENIADGWVNAEDLCRVVETLQINDEYEQVIVCLNQSIDETDLQFIQVRAETSSE